MINVVAFSDLAENIIKEVSRLAFTLSVNETNYKGFEIHKYIAHEIVTKQLQSQIEHHESFYKLIMKKNIINFMFLVPTYHISDKEAINEIIANVTPHMIVKSVLFGDIVESKASDIFNISIKPFVNVNSYVLELSIDKVVEREFIYYILSQRFFRSSIILRLISKRNKDTTYLVSNYYLLGNYTSKLDMTVNLLISSWK